MKHAAFILVIALVVCTAAATGQSNPNSEMKHILVAPRSGTRTVSLGALSIDRGRYPSVIHLRGNVEIKTPVCVHVGSKEVCDGETIIRADRAEFDENTGKVEAHGEVTLTPVRRQD